MRAVCSRLVRFGRAFMFCVGSAVVLAVLLGTATTALAAVPGDPFKLGRLNAVNRVTSLAGGVIGPLLRVDNNGGGPALALESNPGAPPLTVNAGSGKAPHLDADKLDGKDASAFLPAGGKAQDAARADKAGDAGTLDGLDSGQLMRDTAYAERTRSTADSSGHKVVTAPCQQGHAAIGGSARITATRGPGTGSEVPVALTVSEEAGSGWRAEAQEMVPYEGDWYLLVHPICVPRKPELAVDGAAEAGGP